MPAHSFRRIVVLLSLAIFVGSIFSAQASANSQEGRYIVVLKDSVEHPGAIAEDQADETGGDVSLVYRSALKGYAATLPKDEVEALEEDPRVDYVTPDRKVKTSSQTTPTGVERIFADENPALAINGEEDVQTDVDVAVIDTGIDYTHPDLNVVARTSCVPVSEKDEPATCVDNSGTDGFGHGTHVAGIIGALDNGYGTVGVAPGARLWAVQVFPGCGCGYESWIVAGVDWVTTHASQIEVANMSLGCWCEMPALEKAINASIAAGVVYALAAGNFGIDAKYFSPANDPEAITVSALADYDGKPGGEAEPTCKNIYGEIYGYDDQLANFSDRGAGVDVAAPGVCIRSTVPTSASALFPESEDPKSEEELEEESEETVEPDPGYGTLSGTSMAAPYVAGAAALLAARSNPNSKADVMAIRDKIVEEGNSNWTDSSGDGVKEPLLDVGDQAVFNGTTSSTKAASGVTLNEATLHGVVNPQGNEASYQFEYGTTTSYGSKVPASPKGLGSGSSDVNVDETIGGLKSKTTYHYRVVVFTGSGKLGGQDLTFSTPPSPPTVKTEAATEHFLWGALLHGTVNPNGTETTYKFEYGTTTSYGHSAPVPAHVVGSGSSNVSLSEWAAEVEPSTTYHYRIAATNAGGTSYGEDMEFTTSLVNFEGYVHLNSPYLGAIDCAMYGQIELNEGALDKGALTELGFRYCGPGTALLTWCQVDTTFEGGNFNADPETSSVSIDNLHLTMTYKGGSCYAGGIPWHLSGSIGGEVYEGEEESELVLDGSHLLYEDWNMFGTSMSMGGTLYIEGPPKLVP